MSRAGIKIRGWRTWDEVGCVSGGARGGGGGSGPWPGVERGPAGGRMSVGLRWGGAMTAGRSPQAKYLAQIILVGAQVVGRAFMRALRQEFAGRS